MTKKLSKQLCELCGMKGVWIKYTTETTDGCVNLGSKLTYPDFGKPENFVKLFKIIVTTEDYIYHTGYYTCFSRNNQLSLLTNNLSLYEYESKQSDPIKAFIECVIECAKAEKDTAEYIKEQEWSYD